MVLGYLAGFGSKVGPVSVEGSGKSIDEDNLEGFS